MDVKSLLELNPLLSDRVRLAIMTALSAADGPMDFTTLLQTLELSKGNLSTHMRKLEEGGLVDVKKEFVGRKPRTTYRCSKSGQKELTIYLEKIENILKQAKGEAV